VNIIGNLVVDKLQTDWGSRGLASGGKLIVAHDPYILGGKKDGIQLDPFRISIGSVRTLYSVKSQ